MKVLVTGYTGQLGFDAYKEGINRGHQMIGVGSKELDITDQEHVSTYIKELKPEAIIHCAAYTAVDQAEEDQEQCWNVNVNGTKWLVEAAKAVGAKFMYISTDYVFNGKGDTPFSEGTACEPVGYYGYTKYEGEKVVQTSLSEHFIVRISWVFGTNGHNFVKTMLRLAESKTEVSVVDDQIGSPTYTYDLARLLIDMIQTDNYGTYHATNEGFCSWAEFAEAIFKESQKDVKVNYIRTEDYPTKAERPKNSRLSKERILENGFEPLQPWKEALRHYIHQLNEVK